MTTIEEGWQNLTIRRKERKVINLISAAHFFSHFFILALPPLFLAMKKDLNITFTELGMITSIYAFGSFAGQYPMGVWADRIGPRWILLGGITTVSLAFITMGLIPVYWVLLVLGLIAGLGDSVFHPANFVVLTASVDQKRVGKAYAVHAFAGFSGFAAAPIIIDPLRVYSDWQTALMIIGFAGLMMALVLFANKDILISESENTSLEIGKEGKTHLMGVFDLIKFPPIIILFIFYITVALAGNGIQQFSSSALPAMYGINLSLANQILFIFLVGISMGVLVGGHVADKVNRLELVASVCYAIGIAMICLVGSNYLPFYFAAAALVVSGFMTGVVMPSRDMLVRAVTPKGNTGKAFGFVNSGFGLGGMIGPIVFGQIMDSGAVSSVYYASAAFMFCAIIAAIAAGRYARDNYRGY